MEFSNFRLLVGAILLVVALVNYSDASTIGDKISEAFPDAKEKFDLKAAVGGDGNIVIAMGERAIKEIHDISGYHTRTGPIGEAMIIFRNGWENSLKMIAHALDEGFDLVDNLLDRDIEDKIAALNAINNGIDDIKTLIYQSGIPVHACLGAGKLISNITDRGEFKYAIDKVQETATGIFDDMEVVKFIAIQGLNADDDEVTKKCLQAAHHAIRSAAEIAYTNFVAGAKSACVYLANSDESTIKLHEPTEKLISDVAKAAAAADSDTVLALESLDKDCGLAIEMGIDGPVLSTVEAGLKEYIEYSAWSVAVCYDAIEKVKALAKTDPRAAIRIYENAIETAKAILIDGSVKAYEGLGTAAALIGTMDLFNEAIEIAERSRVEGTKGFESAKTVAIRGILTGGKATEHALDASHNLLEAIEAVIFDQLHAVRNKTFQQLKY